MLTEDNFNQFKHIFLVGIAGNGMCPLAHYLNKTNKLVSGSDRYFSSSSPSKTRSRLQTQGIKCFEQNGNGITSNVDLVVRSTAVEVTNIEIQKANQLGILVILRSDLLSLISKTKKTIAIGGTCGKSTTTGMIYHILQYCGYSPSLITGGELRSLLRQNNIGNCAVGNSDWLVIQADQSDGSIVKYTPQIGVLLNISKDHKTVNQLIEIFREFRNNSKIFIINQGDKNSLELSKNNLDNFGYQEVLTVQFGHIGRKFKQQGFSITFIVQDVEFRINEIGKHNLQNALAAIAVSIKIGVPLTQISKSLQSFEGISRRNQLIGVKNKITVIDDFAHNPKKCSATIRSLQLLSQKIIAMYQPHGFTPTKFMRQQFIFEFSQTLRKNDQIWMSEVYYVQQSGVEKTITSQQIVLQLKKLGVNAHFVIKRQQFLESLKNNLQQECIVVLMGARDPTLSQFAHQVFSNI